MSEELKALPVGVRRVIHELRLSMQVFRDYGYQHQDKAESADDPKERAERERKAKRNFDRAAACEDALDFFAASRTPTEAEPSAEEVERVAQEIESFMLGRVGHQVCVNAAKAVLALRSTTPASEPARTVLAPPRDPFIGTIKISEADKIPPAVAVDDDALVERLLVVKGAALTDGARDTIQQAADCLQSLQASVRVKDEAIGDALELLNATVITPDAMNKVGQKLAAALSDQPGGE